MTVLLGTMSLPAPEDADLVRTYLNGTHGSGGLWEALTRSSNHDHTGGANGKPISVSSIPDGSITTGKLDPSVLLPYALVDGSKPFTGQVTMNADQLIRDTLRFGAKPAGVADVTLARTGAGALRVDTHLGVGVNPAAWDAAYRAVQVGPTAALTGAGSGGASLRDNSYTGASGNTALVTGAAVSLTLAGGALTVYTAPSVAAGAAQTYAPRLALAPAGTVTLTPDAATAALAWGTGRLDAVGANMRVMDGTGNLELYGAGGYVWPSGDGLVALGAASHRWSAVYAVAGAINTSSAAVKEGITPLSPAECYQAAKDVRWYSYAYLPPAYTPPEPPPDIAYDAADDNETKAEKKAARDDAEATSKAAHLKMVAETAPARHQRGFVFPAGAESKDEAGGTLPPVPDLFGLSDRESTTPQADLATLGCALQEVIRRLEALEVQS